MTPEDLARLFHETYEDLAPKFAYDTRPESSKPWALVPGNNRRLMIATAEVVMERLGNGMARQRRAIATALDVLEKTSDNLEVPVGVHTARAALRFGVGLDVSDEELERLKVVDPELVKLPR